MPDYLKAFSFEKSLSYEAFEKEKESMKWIKSNSSLRKVYDSYLDLLRKEDKEIQVQIWFAKVGYQETRTLFPTGFLPLLEGVFRKIQEEKPDNYFESFKMFLEVFVAYHKYLNPRSN